MFPIPADDGGVDEGEVEYYKQSMVWLSRLRFQLIPGIAATHEGTAEPKHDDANLRHVIEVARITKDWEVNPVKLSLLKSVSRIQSA